MAMKKDKYFDLPFPKSLIVFLFVLALFCFVAVFWLSENNELLPGELQNEIDEHNRAFRDYSRAVNADMLAEQSFDRMDVPGLEGIKRNVEQKRKVSSRAERCPRP